jgi:uncharacterized membrane protein YqhA
MKIKFEPSSILGYILKIISFISVLAILCLSIGISYYALNEIYDVLNLIIGDYAKEDKVVEKCLHGLDMILLGTVFMTVACGLFELFVKKIPNLPKWLVINDLDDLKGMIIKMIIVVMAISFTGKVITWNGDAEIMQLGIGFSLAVAALGFFLWIKAKENT